MMSFLQLYNVPERARNVLDLSVTFFYLSRTLPTLIHIVIFNILITIFISFANYLDIQFAFTHGSLFSIRIKDSFAVDTSKNTFLVVVED